MRDIAERVAEHLSAPVTFAASAGPDTRNYRVDFGKITSVLPAYQPQWTIPQGIAELARDMARNGLTAADFEGPRYVRLERIRQLQRQGLLDQSLRREPQPAGA
jgi:hypothetical protein